MTPRSSRSGSATPAWSAAGADAMADRLLAELATDVCFAAFQSAELRRLPCSHCSAHHGTHGAGTGTPAAAGIDIYGARIDNREAGGECAPCVICGKAVGVSRYAQHLEKCMGLGGRAAKAAGALGASMVRGRAPKPAGASQPASQLASQAAASEGTGSSDSDFAPADRPVKRRAKGKRPQQRTQKTAAGPVPATTANGAVSLIGADFGSHPDSLDEMFM